MQEIALKPVVIRFFKQHILPLFKAVFLSTLSTISTL